MTEAESRDVRCQLTVATSNGRAPALTSGAKQRRRHGLQGLNSTIYANRRNTLPTRLGLIESR